MGLLDQLQAYIQANTPRNTRPAVNPAQVIDQGLLGGRVGQVPDRAQQLAQGLLNAPSQVADLFSQSTAQKLGNVMQNPPKPNPQQWIDAGMELSGMAPVGGLAGITNLRAYHGSRNPDIDSLLAEGHSAQRVAGGYATKNPAEASKYAKGEGGTVYPLDLLFKNPATRADLEKIPIGTPGDVAREMLIKQGFDGLIDDYMDEIVFFNPEQAKMLYQK